MMYMNYFKKAFLLLALVSITSPAFALFGSGKRRRAKRLVNTSLSENREAINQAGETGAQDASNTLSSDVENAVASAGSDSDLTGKLSMLAGVASIGYGVTRIGPCLSFSWGDCALMALAFAQAGSMFGQGGSAFDTRDMISGVGVGGVYADPGAGDGYTENIDDGGTGLNDNLDNAFATGNSDDYLNVATLARSEIEDGISAIEAAGLTVNRETGEVFDPKGNKINPPANGVPSSVTNKINAAMEKMKNDQKAKLLAGGFSSGGGGSGNGSGGFNGSGLEDPFALSGSGRGPASNAEALKKKKDFLAGLSNDANGGIGVEGDDIFKMMTRRYTKKIKSREFIFKKKTGN